MLAVGEYVLGHVDDQTLKLTTGFAGGAGGTRAELCGALSAGIMIIGARHGRAQAGVDDKHCQALVTRYRERFLQTFGSTCCGELRPRYATCAVLVEQAAQVLLEILEEDANDGKNHMRD
jgi:C_GCAxxG_C_C family probable redox protein